MKQLVDQANLAAVAAGAGQGGKGGTDWDMGKGLGKGAYQALMNEKHFRRIDKFDGNPAKFKSWMFDLVTAFEYVEHDLARGLKDQIKLRPNNRCPTN